MKPETLNITHEIMNIIHMDPESKKYFGEHKPVQYIKFSSNGAITVHFIEGQQRDLIKGSELRTRSGGLEGIDGDILEQIFPGSSSRTLKPHNLWWIPQGTPALTR